MRERVVEKLEILKEKNPWRGSVRYGRLEEHDGLLIKPVKPAVAVSA